MDFLQPTHYNYIFTGTGLSALMTVYKMVKSGKFNDKTILLLDENPKKTNDRTWCFWEKTNGEWDNISSKKWNTALFANKKFNRELALSPYQYKMIRGLDFYNFVFEAISEQRNITFANQKITSFSETTNGIIVKTEVQNFSCDKLFNSIYKKEEVESQSKYPLLRQHFIGWFIKTGNEVFNPGQPTFMDFSVQQKGNTRFMYVLPTSKTEALIEYTLFSHQLLEREEYETEIKNYIQKLGISSYKLIEKEQGSIPMTCYPFWKSNTKNSINIGSSGGWTKASTGYTFKNSDKKSTRLIEFLQNGNDFRKFHKRNKFWFYDLLLLDILDRNNKLGSTIFSSLFKKGNTSLIFKFLDEETSIPEDIRVILKCPKLPFIKALFRSLGKIA